MAVNRRTIDLLPKIFQTNTNRRFLNATIDQLVQEPQMIRMSSYVGRAEGSPTYVAGDPYLKEGDSFAQYYQLEPSLIVRKRDDSLTKEYKIDNVYNYLDILNRIGNEGGINNDNSILFTQEYYNYQGFIDLEKMINYGQYYWIPNGPDSVDVNNGGTLVEDTFHVTIKGVDQSFPGLTEQVTGAFGHVFSGFSSDINPTITLVRGGSYTFDVNQPGIPFNIQTETGDLDDNSGSVYWQQNISKREVFGVNNNGSDYGPVVFNVPKTNAQDEFSSMTVGDAVDIVIDTPFNQIQNNPITLIMERLGGLDGIQTGSTIKRVIFTDTSDDNWYDPGNYDGGFDNGSFDSGSPVSKERRKGIWQLKVEEGIVRCTYISDWNSNVKLLVKEGRKYGNRSVYKDSTLTIRLVPVITANLDTLYYQSPAYGFGMIKLVEPDASTILNINDILGQTTYTSPNGVRFTSGLKVKFTQIVEPAEYKNREYIVENVGKAITLTPWDSLVTPEQYTKSLGSGFDADNEAFDATNFNSTLNAPIDKDYIVIDRSSSDGNPWSRGNRWFHKDVLNYSASLLTPGIGYPFNETSRAKRPVIEFIADLKLFNGGSNFLGPVSLIDVNSLDALSLVEGQEIAYTDGSLLSNGTSIVFANDLDPDVRATIYDVTKIKPTLDVPETFQTHLTARIKATDGDSIVIVSGVNNQGYWYRWSETEQSWKKTQQKIGINVEPLFDVFKDGVSLSDTTVYPSSSFVGSKLFSYKQGSGSSDTELNFPLSYRSIGNIGDIQFTNNFDQDKFTYSVNNISVELAVNIGNPNIKIEGLTYRPRNPWSKVEDSSKQYVVESFVATLNRANDFIIPALFKSSRNEHNVFVWINGVMTQDYQLFVDSTNKTTLIHFANDLAINDEVLVKMYGVNGAVKSIYTVPKNLERNSFNDVFEDVTLGQMRDHLVEMTYNNVLFQGEPTGNNNLRDIDYLLSAGSILQHSAPFHTAQLMFNNPSTDILKSIDHSRREYARFKEKFLELLENTEFANPNDSREVVDKIMLEITDGADPNSPFYYTDMVVSGNNFLKTQYIIFNPADKRYNTINNYNYDSAEMFYIGLLVYLNGSLLTRGKDYSLANRIVTIDDSIALAQDDVLDIYEYKTSKGCMVPATPSKLGIYPSYQPAIYTDTTIFSTNLESYDVIQGHDGSLTLAFGDFRDQAILEFEKRVYNNIHIDWLNDNTLAYHQTAEPTAFRRTDYSLAEWTQLLSLGFLEWAGRNGLEIFENTITSNDPFSYNYSQATDRVFGDLIPGYWRGIYKYFYETDRPHTHPWEVAGYPVKPVWWETKYGPAPYTSGNLVMWQDLENGVYYTDPNTTGIFDTAVVDDLYVKPGLASIIPVDEHGNLLPPITGLVKQFDFLTASSKWRFGDSGPVETAWRRSSDYPFAVMTAYALARPAQFCNYTFNLLEYKRDEALDQIVNRVTNNRKLGVNITDDTGQYVGTNIWIRDRLVSLGLDVDTNFRYIFEDVTLNLSYKMGGYTDKQYLKILAEQSSPASKNTGVLIPDENYDVVLTKSAPTSRDTYTAVLVEKVDQGYSVSGFDTNKPYFTIIPSLINNNNYLVKVGPATAIIYQEGQENLLVVPYGTVFNTRQQVCDFLISYGRYLTAKGFQFLEVEEDTTTTKDWSLSVKEFLFFSQQGWDDKSIISLTPAGNLIKFDNGIATVEDLSDSYSGTRLLNSDNNTVNRRDYRVYRDGTSFEIQLNDRIKGIHLLDLTTHQYEHTLVFDNTTVFNDVIYQPKIGNRQQRLKIIGKKTGSWNGSLYAPGFMINHKPVEMWAAYKDYYRGDLVEYKNKYYTASKFFPGSDTFEISDWYQVNNDVFSKKLIPNSAFNAQQFQGFYDVDSEDVNVVADMQGRHATGYQPRQYFTDISLDSVSQHKFYLGMIAEKGTKAVINKFLRAKLPYLDNDIEVNEEWAVREGRYGNVENRDAIEMSLKNMISVNSNIIIELLNKNDAKDARWNTFKSKDLEYIPASYDKDIFKRTAQDRKKIATAGPVKLNEVNATVYDVNKMENISPLANILGEGSKIWVASDIDDDWNIYRASNDYGMYVKYAEPLGNGEVVFTTGKPHGLVKRDKVMIRGAITNVATAAGGTMRTGVNGVFRIREATSTTFTVRLSTDSNTSSVLSGPVRALLFKLMPVRYDSRAAFAIDPPYRGWKTGDIVYIDSVDGGWQVLENTETWSFQEDHSPLSVTSNDDFGQAMALFSDQTTVIISSTEDQGTVYAYGRDDFDTWAEIQSITPPDSGSVDFGNSLSVNDMDYIISGAPNTSGIYRKTYSTSNGNAPNGSAVDFQISNLAQDYTVTAYDMTVTVDGITQTPTTDYIIYISASITYVRFNVAPLANTTVVLDYIRTAGAVYVMKKEETGVIDFSQILFDDYYDSGDLYGSAIATSKDGKWLYVSSATAEEVDAYQLQEVTTEQNTYTGNGSTKNFVMPLSARLLPATPMQVKVYIDSVLQVPYADYVVDNTGVYVQMGVAPYTDSTVIVEYSNYYDYVETISNPSAPGNGFGSSIVTSTDGKQIIISAPGEDQTVGNKTYTGVGALFVYDRSTENFISDGISTIYDPYFYNSASYTDQERHLRVSIDGVETTSYSTLPVIDVDGSTIVGIEVTLDDAADSSAIITIDTNAFTLVTAIDCPDAQDGIAYGSALLLCPNNCSIYASAPSYKTKTTDTGRVYRHINLAKIYGDITGSVEDPTVTPGDIIRINGYQVVLTGSDADSVVDDINAAGIPGVSATKIVDTNKVRIYTDSQLTFNKLTITNDYGSAIEDLGLEIYPSVQEIDAIYQEDGFRFGETLAVSSDASKLLIGSTKGSTYSEMTLDTKGTTFDGGSTYFRDRLYRSGSVYLYEYQPSSTETASDVGRFAYATKYITENLDNEAVFGRSIAIGKNWVMIAAPHGKRLGTEKGTLNIFVNKEYKNVWNVIRSKPTEYDSRKITRAMIYNSYTEEVVAELPILDGPAGKILPSAFAEIDFVTNYDPAVYNSTPSAFNVDSDRKNVWGPEHVGKIWWDTNALKYLEPAQDDLITKSSYKDTVFPDSKVNIYQWIESQYTPTQYTEVMSDQGMKALYTVNNVYSQLIVTDPMTTISTAKYYFWVTTTNSVNSASNTKINNLIQNMTNPRSTNIPYLGILASNAISLYNCKNLIGGDYVLRIEYNKTDDAIPVHEQWSIYKDQSQLGLSDYVYNRILDSMAAQDAQGRQVPDLTLKEKQRYGFEVRPRQTILADYLAGRKFFWVFANDFFSTYPIRLIRNIDSFLDFDPYPDVTQYYESVENDIELNYLNSGDYYDKVMLIKNDGLIGGGWTLRKLIGIGDSAEWQIQKSQTYDVRSYWTYSDWYAQGYSADTIPTYYVDFNVDMINLNLKNNDVVKILNSNAGGFQMVRVSNGSLELIAQENATIQILPTIYDPVTAGQGLDGLSLENIGFARDNNIEMRKLFDAIVKMLNNSTGVFVDEFRKLGRNLFDQGLTLIANQFKHTDWLMKTSFISINHKIRELSQIPFYVKQPETIVEDYIKEVKPYHAKIRKYTSIYPGSDNANMFSTDFDLPPYLTIDNKYRSPQIENPEDGEQISSYPNRAWLDNYTYEIDLIDVVDGGANYTNDTVLTILGKADVDGNVRGSGAKARVRVKTGGVITQIILDNRGGGYIDSPDIVVQGTGTGAVLKARMRNNRVRTMKSVLTFDRYTYESTIEEWQGNTVYNVEDIFFYNYVPYRVIEAFESTDVIDLSYVIPYKFYKWEPNINYRQRDILVTDWANSEAYEVMENHTSSNTVTVTLDAIKKEFLTGDGSTTDFHISLGTDVVKVFVDGVYQSMNLDYEIDTIESVDYLIFYSAPAESAFIEVYYSGSLLTPYYGVILDNAADRIWSYYKAAPGQAGRNLAQLMKGIDYPGVKVTGTTFDFAPGFDLNKYDIGLFSSVPTTTESDTSNIDTIYYSDFTDENLGIRSEDIITDGSKFVDAYSSHAPEELVPGRVFDTLDIRVTTIAGEDLSGDAAAPDIKLVGIKVGNETSFQFSTQVIGDVEKLIVWTNDLGFVKEDQDFTVNWISKTVDFLTTLSNPEDTVYILSIGTTGNNILSTKEYLGDGSTSLFELTDERKSIIGQVYIKINGVETTAYTLTWNTDNILPWSSETFYSRADLFSYSGKVYRPLEDFTTGPVFDSTLVEEYDYSAYILFDTPPADNDYIQLRTFNESDIKKAYSSIKEITTTVTSTSATPVYPDEYVFNLPEVMQYYQPWDALLSVRLNGQELCPPNNTYYTGDGTTAGFTLPLIGDVTAATISNTDIVPVIDGVKKKLNIDYTIYNDGSSDPVVVFNSAPYDGAKIVISDSSIADFKVDETTVRIKEVLTITGSATDLAIGDKITILQFSNHDMYDMRTQVFKGVKSTVGAVGGIDGGGFDSFGWDIDSITIVSNPVYEFSRPVTSPAYLQVFVNGVVASPVVDYLIQDQQRLIISPTYGLQSSDVVFIRHFSESTRNSTLKYRIFKNMIDETQYLGIGIDHQTALAQDLAIDDAVIYVQDSSKLSFPGISSNQPGVIFVDGERITYWQKNDVTNTLSQIRRATGGTGGKAHAVGTIVEDGSAGMSVPNTTTVTTTNDVFSGDGSTAVFTLSQDGTNDTVRVSIDGHSKQPVLDFEIEGTFITFTDAPSAATLIEIVTSLYQEKIWYDIEAGGQVGPDGSTLVVKTTGNGIQYVNTEQVNYLRSISR